MTQEYTASQIEILEGLEAVRRRPGMYIGSTGTRGLHHLVWEVVDNAIDEYLAGYGNQIEVTIHKNNWLTVKDYGRGIPVDIHPETGRPAAETVLTTLHAGGKFGGGGYKISGGLHGVGVSVVNALSEKLVLTVERDGKKYVQEYSRGTPVTELTVVGKSTRTGTTVSFLPDAKVFDTVEWDADVISSRLKEYAFLNKGLVIVFKDEREGQEREEFFSYQGGLVDFVKELTKHLNPIHDEIFYVDEEVEGVRIQVAFRYVDSPHERFYSFANNVKTVDGGYHEIGLKASLTRSLNTYGKNAGLLKGDLVLSGSDVREGIVCVLSVYLENPQFEGQTKNKLGNSHVRGLVETLVSERLQVWLENNPKDAQQIIEKALEAMQVREATKKARETVRRGERKSGSGGLPGKLVDCRSRNVEERELFIVEGDSAGGTAKQARNRETQAVLPLRGKILNVERVRMDRVFDNEEVRNIIQVLGCGVGEEYDPNKLRYGKVIILVDADVDGAHISTLLQTFFYRYMRPLIEEGRIYFAQPPLYSVTKGREKYYFRTDEELKAWLKKHGSASVTIQRFKGLGEMQPEQLRHTAMDPKTRTLLRLEVHSDEKADEITNILMGKSVSARREMIENHEFDESLLDI